MGWGKEAGVVEGKRAGERGGERERNVLGTLPHVCFSREDKHYRIQNRHELDKSL